MADKMMSVDINRSFDVMEKTWNDELYLKFYIGMFRSGLVKDLGRDELATLLCVATFMDVEGYCYPTQEQIADQIGATRQSVSKWIDNLLNFRWNGKPIITRIRQRSGKHPNSVYTVLPISQLAIFDGKAEPIEPKKVDVKSINVNQNDVKSIDVFKCADNYVIRLSLSNIHKIVPDMSLQNLEFFRCSLLL